MKRNVALVLASGGARGIAHIGAIKELEHSGYRISSVAGTSMGALIGGIYACGKIDLYERWLEVLTRRRVFELADFTLSTSGILKGRRIIEELKTFIPDIPIERMDIPFTAVATDIKSESEVVFDSGSLFDAVRASISIPSLFTPVQAGERLLIDGGVTNPLPLDRVKRTDGDILVAVDVSAPSRAKEHKADVETSEEGNSIMERIRRKALVQLLHAPVAGIQHNDSTHLRAYGADLQTGYFSQHSGRHIRHARIPQSAANHGNGPSEHARGHRGIRVRRPSAVILGAAWRYATAKARRPPRPRIRPLPDTYPFHAAGTGGTAAPRRRHRKTGPAVGP